MATVRASMSNCILYLTVYPKKYAHGFCFAVLCCGYTLTDFPISIRLTSLALWQSNDCPSASKATLMNMDKYFMWTHYERLHNHNKAKHNKTVCIFLGIYCMSMLSIILALKLLLYITITVAVITSVIVYVVATVGLLKRQQAVDNLTLMIRFEALNDPLYCTATWLWQMRGFDGSGWPPGLLICYGIYH